MAFNACKLVDCAVVLTWTVLRNKRLAGTPRQTWDGLSMEAFSKWGEYLVYGGPAALMICLEWWAYEVIIIMAGWLPNAEVALSVMGICLNLVGWVYMMPLGLASAVNTRTSNALGAGNAAAAKRTFQAGLLTAVIAQTAAVIILLTSGHHLFPIFCNDESVVSAAKQVGGPIPIAVRC